MAFFTGVSPLRYATADGVADQAATQALIGLPRRLRRPQPGPAALGHPGVGHRGVRSRWSVPDELSLVVVGDAERLAEPLRAAGFGDLEVVTPD